MSRKIMGRPAIQCLILLLGTGVGSGELAQAEQLRLQPATGTIEMRTYGFGVIPFDGKFTRFHGWMRYDPASPEVCEVVLQIEVESLVMASASLRDYVVGPELMDARRFPDLVLHGACHGGAIVGDLAMHGQTRPVVIDTTRSAGLIVATGWLPRGEWGMAGYPLIGGSMARIKISFPDPANPPRV